MTPRRLQFRVGPEKSRPGLPLAAIATFALEFQKAVSAQAGETGDLAVELVKLGGGGSTLLEVEYAGESATQAVDDIVGALDAGKPDAYVHIHHAAARAMHSAAAALQPVEGGRPLAVRRVGKKQARWVEVSPERMRELVTVAQSRPAAPAMSVVRVVGKVSMIDHDRRSLVVHPAEGRSAEFSWPRNQFRSVDKHRWKRAIVTGVTRSPGDPYFDLMSIEDPAGGDGDSFSIDGDHKAEDEFLAGLRSLRENPDLQVSGWDTYSATPLDPKACDRTQRVLISMRAWLTLEGLKLALPRVIPMVDGNIQLEWERGELFMEIQVRPRGRLGYVKGRGNEMTESTVTEANALRLFRPWARSSKGGRK